MSISTVLAGSNVSLLPPELVHVLDEVFFLHLLATDPHKVVPPGKSLLSVMTAAHIGMNDRDVEVHEEARTLQDRIEQIMHETYWEETLASLSAPHPSTQLTRLRALYKDLLDLVSPLLPSTHPVLKSLSMSPPPTTSPLHSTIVILKEILVSLRQRCAPVRDETVDAILRTLDDVPPYQPSLGRVTTPNDRVSSPSRIAETVVKTIQSIISCADQMKSDLTTFVLGSMTDQQLKGMVVELAKIRERNVTLDLWGNEKKDGRDIIREQWRAWVLTLETRTTLVEGASPNAKWMFRLVQALHTNVAITCLLPQASRTSRESNANNLPPQFFFSANALLYIQNLLQAIVIIASLRSLAGIPSPKHHSSLPASPGQDFARRVLSLLESEIDVQTPFGTGETKIENLADEVVRARRLINPKFDEKEEILLRKAVHRTLRTQDPVFVLLQGRLISAMGRYLVNTFSHSLTSSNANIPLKMKSGWDSAEERAGKRPKIADWNFTSTALTSVHASLAIKGFEDPVLVQTVEDVFGKVAACVTWVQAVWGDLV